MGMNPIESAIEETTPVFLAGTFATLYGFTADEEDLLAGRKTDQVELRFFIDEAAKEPYAVLVRVEGMVEADPAEFPGGFQIFRQIDNDLKAAKGSDERRSAKRAFKGTGDAMNYTASAADNTVEREYVVQRTSHREAVARFTSGRHFPEDYKNRWGKVIRTAAQQANDWVLIKQYLDQRGI